MRRATSLNTHTPIRNTQRTYYTGFLGAHPHTDELYIIRVRVCAFVMNGTLWRTLRGVRGDRKSVGGLHSCACVRAHTSLQTGRRAAVAFVVVVVVAPQFDWI